MKRSLFNLPLYFAVMALPVISGCKSGAHDEISPLLLETEKMLIGHTSHNYLLILNLYQQSPEKVRPWYEKGRQIRMKTADLLQLAENMLQGEDIDVADLKVIRKRFLAYAEENRDLLKDLALEDSTIVKLPETPHPDKEILIIKNKTIRLESMAINTLLAQIHSPFCGIKYTSVLVSRRENALSFQSRLVDIENYGIEVDTILQNGKFFKLFTPVKKSYELATLDLDSFPPGRYRIKGRGMGGGNLSFHEVPFDYSFEIR